CRMLSNRPGRAYIVNEAHGLKRLTIRQLLGTLERLPDHVVWIFTTTNGVLDDDTSGNAGPLLSRCTEVSLTTNTRAFAERARWIAMRERIEDLPLSVYEARVTAEGGNLRRVIQKIESGAYQTMEQLRDPIIA